MAYRQILPYTDPLLKQVSAPIGEITDGIKTLATDMIETMEAVTGAGLAAVQVSELVRLFVMIDVPGATALPNPNTVRLARRLVLINPEIIDHSEDEMDLDEGCLSMPNIFFPVPRWKTVTIEFTNLAGRQEIIHGAGYKAVALQHELDHLNGIRNIDRISRLRRDRAIKEFKDDLRRRRSKR